MCKIEDRTCEELIDDFEPKILMVVSKVSYNDREDMMQEIKAKILEKIDMFDDLDVPGFLEFISKNN